jgi:hypothetical protein
VVRILAYENKTVRFFLTNCLLYDDDDDDGDDDDDVPFSKSNPVAR